jgi:hypothetical protein
MQDSGFRILGLAFPIQALPKKSKIENPNSEISL